MTGQPPLLATHDLAVSFRTDYGRVHALAGLDLTVRSRDFQLVVGESGSGKSVLAHTVLGLLPRNVDISGSVQFEGNELLAVSSKRRRELLARRMAFIPQSAATALNPVRQIGHLLNEGARARGVSRAHVRQRIAEVCASQGLDLDQVRHLYPHQLSGGMQQRVLNSFALLGSPDLVIADEPTKGLDQDRVGDVAKQLRRLTATGAGILVITHDLELAEALGGRIAVLYEGQLVEERSTAGFFAEPAHPYSKGLVAAMPKNGLHPMNGFNPEEYGLMVSMIRNESDSENGIPERYRRPERVRLSDGSVLAHAAS